jgi:hypothetical protein
MGKAIKSFINFGKRSHSLNIILKLVAAVPK